MGYKKIMLAASLLLLMGLLAACGGDDIATDLNYQKITAEDAMNKITENSEVIIVDVRTTEEYTAGHIPGAVLLPNEDIETLAATSLPDFEAEILVYCRTGNRSEQAAKKLLALGYSKVYDFGGIEDWPYETVTGAPVIAAFGNVPQHGMFGSPGRSL